MKLLVIVSLFTFIIESVFHLENEILPLQTNIPRIDNVIKWFNDNKSWGTLFFQAFYILPTWVVFRFAPRYPCHTLPEGFFLQVFLSTLSLLLTFYRLLGLVIIRKFHCSLLLPHSLSPTLRLQLVGNAVALFRHYPLCHTDDDHYRDCCLLYL